MPNYPGSLRIRAWEKRRWKREASLKGFSLVELLTVMAVIVVLAAVSYGALFAAIRSAQSAKCTSNLRQVGVGFNLYLADNNNIMPQRFYPSSPGSHIGTAYYNLLAPYTGNNNTNKSTSVFVCPSHTICGFPLQPSYGMNWYYDNTSILNVPGLSTTIMAAETAGPDGTGSNRADQNSGTPGELAPTRHGAMSNYLFFDGHIQKLLFSDTTNMWGTDMGNHNQPSP